VENGVVRQTLTLKKEAWSARPRLQGILRK
jgi:hypothetical protein